MYANEVPDLADDEKSGKFTWASVMGRRRAYLLYCALVASAFLFIILNVNHHFIRPVSLISLFLIFTAAKAAMILKTHPDNKNILVKSSQLTIAMTALVSLILIVTVIL